MKHRRWRGNCSSKYQIKNHGAIDCYPGVHIVIALSLKYNRSDSRTSDANEKFSQDFSVRVEMTIT